MTNMLNILKMAGRFLMGNKLLAGAGLHMLTGGKTTDKLLDLAGSGGKEILEYASGVDLDNMDLKNLDWKKVLSGITDTIGSAPLLGVAFAAATGKSMVAWGIGAYLIDKTFAGGKLEEFGDSILAKFNLSSGGGDGMDNHKAAIAMAPSYTPN
ncbi:MAG: hypothetical protein K9G62_08960 [Alphaproteobacteria bacterium]|nr:hypothetical protein [Alphaproteobacteria bacterium]